MIWELRVDVAPITKIYNKTLLEFSGMKIRLASLHSSSQQDKLPVSEYI